MMPRNISGIKCVKCGFCFESEYNSRNKKRKVCGSVFWEKYERYYFHVRERIELKRTDVLCNSCHHEIDRCKTSPEAGFIKDIRLFLLEADKILLDTVEAVESEETLEAEMSSVMSGSKLQRFISSQDASPNAKRVKVSCKADEKQSETGKSSYDDQNNEENTLDNNDLMADGEMGRSINAAAVVQINTGCQDLTSNKETQMLENRLCTSGNNSQFIAETELMYTINEMIENGIFYNDELDFSIDRKRDLKLKVNRQILQLWLVRRVSTNYYRKSIHLDTQTANLLGQIIKFVHSGVTSSYDDFCKILGNQDCVVANHFLLGLFLYESLSKFTNKELKEIAEKVNRNVQSCILTKLTSFFVNNVFPLKIGLNETFKFIEENFDVWNNYNVLDGDDIYNFSEFQKYSFYFWLYHKKSSQPSVSALSHVLSCLKPSVTVEADECFEYISLETNTHRNVRVHSLILFLRQEVNYREYLVNVNRIRSNIRVNTYSTDCIHLFIEILYFGSNRFQRIINPHFFTTLIELVQVFHIKHPLKLFGCEDHPNSALDVRLMMELFLKSGSQKYMECLLRKPRDYLKHDFTSLLHTRHMYNILIQDDLQLNEIEVYKLVVEFAENEWCDDEEEEFKTSKGRLDKLLRAVRFGIMTNEEFKVVRSQSYLSQEERRDFFYLIHNPDEPVMVSLKKFHEPTTKRRLIFEELKIQCTS